MRCKLLFIFPLFLTSSLIGCANKEVNVIFNGDNHIIYIGESKHNSGADFEANFKVDYLYEVNFDTIKINIGNEAIDDYEFSAISNINITLKINASKINGDINININTKETTHKPTQYGIEDSINSTKYNPKREGDPTDIGTDKPDKVTYEYTYPVKNYVVDKDVGLSYPIMQDDRIEVKIIAVNDYILPGNIWLRTNARYAQKNLDFTMTWSGDSKSVTMKVPYYVIKDHAEFRFNPDAPEDVYD